MNQSDPGRPIRASLHDLFVSGLRNSDIPQEIGAIAAGINHELIRRFGRTGNVHPIFSALDTTTLPPKKINEYKMKPGHAYVMVWVPGDEERGRPSITLCRIEIGEHLKLEIEQQGPVEPVMPRAFETLSVYEYSDPMSLEKLYGSIAEILESTLWIFPSSDS